MTDEFRLPWDPLWEYVLSDYEDEGDDDSTVPTVETAQGSLPERKNLNSTSFPKSFKAKSINRLSEKRYKDGRDENASMRHPWRRRQERDVDDGDAQVSMWDLLGPDFDPGERARRENRVSNKKSTSAFTRNTKKLKQRMRSIHTKTSPGKRSEPAQAKSVKRNLNLSQETTRQKVAIKEEWDDEDFAPLIMVFDVMERFERLDPLGFNRTFSSDSQASGHRTLESSSESESRFRKQKTRRAPAKESSKTPIKSTRQRVTTKESTKASKHNSKSFLNHSSQGTKLGANKKDDSNIDFQETRSCLNGKDFLRISMPAKNPDQNLNRTPIDYASTPKGVPKDGTPQNIQKLVCFNKVEDHSNGFMHQLNAKDIEHFFPAVRMVSDSNVQTPMTKKSEGNKGVMGIPSDKFLETKGPQSLYEYDYSSNEHMDVSYSTHGEDSISSFSVRRLGPLASLVPLDFFGAKVLIQVEASTVSATDCDIRRGRWRSESQEDDLPKTPGVDIVGKVYGISQADVARFNLYPGQTVVSLVKWGGNSRFISLNPEKLVKVPEGMDPAQATCLAETYLAAFQMLHHRQNGSRRYLEQSLKGKLVLIVGPVTNSFGKATMELALQSGAAIVFATAKKQHWKMLIELGVIPLDPDPLEWVDRVAGTIDLLLAPKVEPGEEPIRSDHFLQALRDTGHFVTHGHHHKLENSSVRRNHKNNHIVCKPIKVSLDLVDRCYAYDVYEEWDRNLDVCKKDLMHLLGMLERNIIKPRILDRIPLSKVAKAQSLIQSRRKMTGFLVCEPWMQMKKRVLYL